MKIDLLNIFLGHKKYFIDRRHIKIKVLAMPIQITFDMAHFWYQDLDIFIAKY